MKLTPRIREKRMEAHMSLTELSNKINMNLSHLSKIENGKIYPYPQALWTIAKGIGCSVDELYEVVK